MTIENWDLGVQDRFFYRHGFEGPLKKEKKGFLVLFFVFSLGYHVFSGVSLIKYSGRTTDIKKAPSDFSEERKFFFCTFEQERRPFKIGKFHLCSKRQYRDKKRAIYEG